MLCIVLKGAIDNESWEGLRSVEVLAYHPSENKVEILFLLFLNNKKKNNYLEMLHPCNSHCELVKPWDKEKNPWDENKEKGLPYHIDEKEDDLEESVLESIYGKYVEDLRKSLKEHQKEYNALTKETKGDPPGELSTIGEELVKMNTKLDKLSEGQQDIRDDISKLKSSIIARFEANERKIISVVLDRFEQSELAMVSTMLNGIDTINVAVSNIEETLASVREALIEVHGQGNAIEDTVLAQVVGETLKIVDDPKLDFRQRLKVTIPIIPLIMKYERIIELKSSVNLKEVWEWLRKKLGG